MKTAAIDSKILRGPQKAFRKDNEDATEHRRNVEGDRKPGSRLQ
jgi:hypothetical protein